MENRASSGLELKEIRLGRVRITYLDVNLGVRPNDAWAGRGEILKFRPVQTTLFSLQVLSD
jgi:hypothetical protein